MRACFLRQNVCALGYGVAMVQTLPAGEESQNREPTAEEIAINVVGNSTGPYIHRQFWTVSSERS